MKKILTLLSLFLVFLVGPSALADELGGSGVTKSSGGAASAANKQKNLSALGSKVASTYASVQAGQCGRFNYGACVRSVIATYVSMRLTKHSNDSLKIRGLYESGGIDWGDTAGSGEDCYTSNSCDGDNELEGLLDEAFKTGTADDHAKAMEKLSKNNKKVLDDLKKKGFDLDTESGTITDANGKKTKISSEDMSLSKALDSSSLAKISDYKKKLESSPSEASGLGSRAVASSKPSGHGLSSGGLSGLSGLSNRYGSKGKSNSDSNNKDKKEKFLAALANKKKGGVGVAGDNLFKMIQRRYDKKTKTKEFLSQ